MFETDAFKLRRRSVCGTYEVPQDEVPKDKVHTMHLTVTMSSVACARPGAHNKQCKSFSSFI